MEQDGKRAEALKSKPDEPEDPGGMWFPSTHSHPSHRVFMKLLGSK